MFLLKLFFWKLEYLSTGKCTINKMINYFFSRKHTTVGSYVYYSTTCSIMSDRAHQTRLTTEVTDFLNQLRPCEAGLSIGFY